jgi:parvulin-like peptidyl-prolyl isomerase
MWRPDDSTIEAYYNAHVDEFLPAKPVTIREIVVTDSVLAEFIRDQAMSGIDLADLAKDYPTGEQTLKAKLVDPGKVGQADVDPAIWEAIDRTPAGHVTDVVKVDGDYHVVKVLAKERVYNLVQARGQVSSILMRQHRQNLKKEYLAMLSERYNVRLAADMPRFYLKPLRYRTDTEL